MVLKLNMDKNLSCIENTWIIPTKSCLCFVEIQIEYSSWDRDARSGPKVGHINLKWDKSGTFSDQISVHLAPPRQMHWNLI